MVGGVEEGAEPGSGGEGKGAEEGSEEHYGWVGGRLGYASQLGEKGREECEWSGSGELYCYMTGLYAGGGL